MDVEISPLARIDCDYFHFGEGTIIKDYAHIYGTRVVLGEQSFVDEYAVIGGGSAFDSCAFLEAGDFLHMGMFSQINIARGVNIGNEVGIGVGTKIFTHGSYLSEWDGFPVEFAGVKIGDRVWLPNAQVNPGVEIGSNIVVAAGSVVNDDLPDGCFAGGIPAKVIKKDCYPKEITTEQKIKFLNSFSKEMLSLFSVEIEINDTWRITCDGAIFDFDAKLITGAINLNADLTKNQLRRRGIRFKDLR